MQSILVVSRNREQAKEYIDKLCKSEKIHPIDININYFEKIIGIEEIRSIRKKIFLKPLKSKTKIVVVEAHEGITIESQNALLKILEEPPNNTIIIVALSKIGLILPTVLSRCKVVDLKDKSIELSKQETTQYLNVFVSLLSSGVGDRLKLAQDIAKNKDEIIPVLEKMILVAREALIDTICHPERAKRVEGSPDASKRQMDSFAKHRLVPGLANARTRRYDNGEIFQYLNILISLQKTHTILKTTNVNPRLALEHLFLNL